MHRLTLATHDDQMGFYSSLAAVNRTDDKGKRSYAATGYLRPNLGRGEYSKISELPLRALMNLR